MSPVAQNVQASGQPDCDDRHTVRRLRWRIATASTGKPSRAENRTLIVPSCDRCTSSTERSSSGTDPASSARSPSGSEVISSYDWASPCVTACSTCLRRNPGWPFCAKNVATDSKSTVVV